MPPQQKDHNARVWLTAIVDFITANGPSTLSIIGAQCTRPSGIKTKLQTFILNCGEFLIKGNVVSLIAPIAQPPARAGINVAESKDMIERSKGGVEIDFIVFGVCNKEKTVAVGVKNCSDVSRSLKNIHICGKGRSQFVLPFTKNTDIPPSSSIKLHCTFHAKFDGTSEVLICFEFHGFGIGRFVSGVRGDPILHEALKPTSPYRKKKSRHMNKKESSDFVGGVAPTMIGGKYKIRMGEYAIPNAWRDCESHVKGSALEKHCQRMHSQGEPDIQHYFDFYMRCLWSEEIQLQLNIQEFNMEDIDLQNTAGGGGCLRLFVPGLAEKRPCVMKGDHLFASRSKDANSHRYQGFVHAVERDSVLLRFHRSFHSAHSDHFRYNVEFSFPRRTVRILYQGLKLLLQKKPRAFVSSLLFPAPLAGIPHPVVSNLPVANSSNQGVLKFQNSSLNEYQRMAVERVVEYANRRQAHTNTTRTSTTAQMVSHHPYVIFGPPGTGKTITVVETILQLVRRFPTKRILVCAPSNTAADILTSRLGSSEHLTGEKLFRLMSFQRARVEVPPEVDAFCRYSEETHGYVAPSLEVLESFQVIVATCAMAGKLHNYGMKENSFSTVVVDEAGHAWEADILAAFVGVLSAAEGMLVLAGDPKQLGPVTHHKHTPTSPSQPEGSSVTTTPNETYHGLELSMLERLLRLPVYQHPGNEEYVTKLLYSYRCHPAIIHVPNTLYYGGELMDATGEESKQMCTWDGLIKPDFPMMFHGIRGEHTREGNSPSWFNPSEVQCIVSYILKLQTTVDPSQIGVIAPYQKQVQKIRLALRQKKISGVMVGSCEQFQGQERKVILISTVRSSSEFQLHDSKYKLGFVSDPKRLNVAVTRAKALCVIVGNPDVLYEDDHWKQLMNHCISHGSYCGCSLPPTATDPRDDDSDGSDSDDDISDDGSGGANEYVQTGYAEAIASTSSTTSTGYANTSTSDMVQTDTENSEVVSDNGNSLLSIFLNLVISGGQ